MTTITLPPTIPFIELARFAQAHGCELITRSATQLEMRPDPKADALRRVLERVDTHRVQS